MQKTAGAPSEAVPLSFRRRAGGEWLGPATQPHHEQAMPRNRAKRDAQTALLPKTQPAAPYAAETSRYVPPLYTYPTKFMHNLCHIVM